MQWNDLPISELAKQLNAKALEHPTSVKFDGKAWVAALAALPERSERDIELAKSAIHYGAELSSLREFAIPRMVAGFNRLRLIRLLAAYANQQHLVLREKVRQELKERKKRYLFDMEMSSQMLLESDGGQKMTPDDFTAYLVDSLPHWLFHIWQVADDAPSHEPEDASQFAQNALAIASVEYSLRSLWLNALWAGTILKENGEGFHEIPCDRVLDEHRFVIMQRHMTVMLTPHAKDAGEVAVAGRKVRPVIPAIPRTVIRIEPTPGGRRKFITGRAIGAKLAQRSHVNERDTLERSYVGVFLDEALPRSSKGQLTCRELNAAWWVLKDLAIIAAEDLGEPLIADDDAVGRFALTVERKDLVAVLRDCIGGDDERCGAIIDWFTCDPGNTSRLFAKSFWSQPLLPEPGSDQCDILLTPLLVGSAVRRIEAWLESGGISDSRGIKGRGKPFERHVRKVLGEAVADNPDLTDAFVAEHGLKRKNESEEIDLLVRIGGKVIVGEIKCFVAPSDPLERFNFLVNLGKATEQAAKKREWAEANRAAIAAAVGITDKEQAGELEFHPLVLLNHGLGMGLERDDVPVVDLHYLKLLLGSSSYQGDTIYEPDIGAIYEPVTLYESQVDLESRMGDLLRCPPVLQRFEGLVGWRLQPFPTSTGRPFHIELPVMKERQVSEALLRLAGGPSFPKRGVRDAGMPIGLPRAAILRIGNRPEA